jgi:hypothetical protein
MAAINKVLYNINQVNDTTSTEKKQARDNIEASQVNYVNAIGSVPTVTVGDLNVVQYQSGLHLNDGQGNIAPLPPEPVQGQTGKILSVTSEGVKWADNQPVRDVFIDHQSYLQDSNSTATQLLWQVQLPQKNGKYPTKVIGSVAANPATGGEMLSILPMVESIYDYTYEVEYEPGVTGTVSATNYKPFSQGSNVNYQHLLSLTDTTTVVPYVGLYENICPFQFKDASQNPGRDLKFVAIKGSNACPKYNLHNIQITCFYEQGEDQ